MLAEILGREIAGECNKLKKIGLSSHSPAVPLKELVVENIVNLIKNRCSHP